MKDQFDSKELGVLYLQSNTTIFGYYNRTCFGPICGSFGSHRQKRNPTSTQCIHTTLNNYSNMLL